MQCRREIIFDHFARKVYIFFKHNVIYFKIMLFVHQNNMPVIQIRLAAFALALFHFRHDS